MDHALFGRKIVARGFRVGPLSKAASSFDDRAANESTCSAFPPIANRGTPEAAALLMVHYADDVHPAPQGPRPREKHENHVGDRVDKTKVAERDLPVVQTGLGDSIDKIAAKSPTLQHNLKKLQESGWGFEYGSKGAGSSTDRRNTAITLDSDKKHKAFSVLQSLAHESGHALYRPPPPTLMDFGVSRQQYIERNTDRCLQDEGEATITGLQVREELLKAKAGDIGVSGDKAKTYLQLYEKYRDPKDHDILRAQIAKVYAQGEHPSTARGMTYEQFCAKPFEAQWDKSHPKQPNP